MDLGWFIKKTKYLLKDFFQIISYYVDAYTYMIINELIK